MGNFRFVPDSASPVVCSDFFDHVALVAHNCYQVKEKDHASNVAFIGRLIANGHLAMIEHHRFLFRLSEEAFAALSSLVNPFQHLFVDKGRYYLSTSLRPLLEASDKEIPAFLFLSPALPESVRAVLPERLQEGKDGAILVSPFDEDLEEENRLDAVYETYHVITDRGVTHELVRHRICSFAQESTRYCNYSKDKFENCLSFIAPFGYEERKEIYDDFFSKAAEAYFALIEKGARPEEARSVLPNALKASIMVTCSLREWLHIFVLRCSPFAHPDIRRVMSKVRDDLFARGLLTEKERNAEEK